MKRHTGWGFIKLLLFTIRWPMAGAAIMINLQKEDERQANRKQSNVPSNGRENKLMPIMLYGKCWRGREDCEAIECIDAEPEELTQEQVQNFDYTPLSFVCCGLNTEANRELKRDAYRLCFKNAATDEMTDNDTQDLTSLIAVISKALNYHAIMQVNGGIIEIPATKE